MSLFPMDSRDGIEERRADAETPRPNAARPTRRSRCAHLDMPRTRYAASRYAASRYSALTCRVLICRASTRRERTCRPPSARPRPVNRPRQSGPRAAAGSGWRIGVARRWLFGGRFVRHGDGDRNGSPVCRRCGSGQQRAGPHDFDQADAPDRNTRSRGRCFSNWKRTSE
jgi:hypothetical protein